MIEKMKIGNQEFSFHGHTYVMGILNMTPDSFSDGGYYNQIEKALIHVEKMIQEGADIIDIGGESTRPNHVKVSDEEEIVRVVPVIQAIKKRFSIPVSIDTYKSKVALKALETGADLVNDIWGLRYDENLAEVVQKYQVPICLMHNRKQIQQGELLKEVIGELQESVGIALKAGIPRNKLMIDPGIGFGKTYEQNLQIMNHLEELLTLDLPILLGTSRKSVIGLTLDLPVKDREEGTITTTVLGVVKGCHFVRVHNIRGNVRAIKMTEAIIRNH